jgi:hypothetical protein
MCRNVALNAMECKDPTHMTSHMLVPADCHLIVKADRCDAYSAVLRNSRQQVVC